MTFARTPYAWRNPHLAGFVALLFTALTLLAVAPHQHAGTNVRETAGAGPVFAETRSAPTLMAPLSSAASSSSCTLCDWLMLPGLPAFASSTPLAQTCPAFAAWVTAAAAPVQARVLACQRPRGPPALRALS
jgi:hypothetical protein